MLRSLAFAFTSVFSFFAPAFQRQIYICFWKSAVYLKPYALSSCGLEKNHIFLWSCYQEPVTLSEAHKELTVFKAFGNEAAAAAEAGSWLVSGKTPDKSLVDGAGWSFDCAYDDETYNNGTMTVPSLILTPVSITAKNIQKELVDTGYYTMEGDYPVSVN